MWKKKRRKGKIQGRKEKKQKRPRRTKKNEKEEEKKEGDDGFWGKSVAEEVGWEKPWGRAADPHNGVEAIRGTARGERTAGRLGARY